MKKHIITLEFSDNDLKKQFITYCHEMLEQDFCWDNGEIMDNAHCVDFEYKKDTIKMTKTKELRY